MKLIKFFLIILLFNLFLEAKDLKPSFTFQTCAEVSELILRDDLLYASTTNSQIDIFDINKKEKKGSIKIPQTKDFLGDKIDSKIYSIDILNNQLLILSQGKKGGRNIFIYENNHLENILSEKKKMFIAKAKFLDEQHLVFALLSNEIYLYDLKKQQTKKITQVSNSAFSDFVLSDDKKYIIISDESGILTMLDTKNLNTIKKFDAQNLDNVYQVDTKNNYIITAGKDRKVGIYNILDNFSYNIKSSFLVYSAALSQDAKVAAYSKNEQNDIAIFDVKTKKELYTLKDNKALITDIIFKNQNEIFTSSQDDKINYYKLK